MLLALALEKPVVATTIGTLGIEGKNDYHFLTTDNSREFSEYIIDFLHNLQRERN